MDLLPEHSSHEATQPSKDKMESLQISKVYKAPRNSWADFFYSNFVAFQFCEFWGSTNLILRDTQFLGLQKVRAPIVHL